MSSLSPPSERVVVVGGRRTERSSDESLATSEDYEIVDPSPAQQSVATHEQTDPKLDIVVGEGNESDLATNLADCLKMPSGEEEAVDLEKTAESVANESHVEEEDVDHTVFHNVLLLGSQDINSPKSEELIQAQLREANNRQLEDEEEVTLSVPRTSEGNVVLRGSSTSLRLPVVRIIFFARGNADSAEAACFAFTSVRLTSTAEESKNSDRRRFTTHLFRCREPDAVSKVFVSFAQAFKRSVVTAAPTEDVFNQQEAFLFELSLEVREKEAASGTFETVPRQKGLFKLRADVEKKVVVTVQQIGGSTRLSVERCFGMLVSPGKNVRHADMQLLEKVTMATSSSSAEEDRCDNAGGTVSYVITGTWDPSETAFATLNRETPSDVPSVYMTVAADLVIQQVAEPVRFVVETRAKVYPQTEKYWYYSKKSLCRQYQVRLKRCQSSQGDKQFSVCGIDLSEEVERSSKMSSLTTHLASLTASTLGGVLPWSQQQQDDASLLSPDCPEEEEGDDDDAEPMLSGFGDVSKDCRDDELGQWKIVLDEWNRENPLSFPRQLPSLVRRGVPEALRGEVWQRVTGASVQTDDIIETYRVLVTKESPDEKVILRDIHRTFPAHEFFKEAGGDGQESLYRISKAYSVYDSEIGYCQGQSFLIAALLLQMPEEQAFGVLVKVMHRWGLRDMFKENFENLQLRLYQLDRLIEVNMPDLWHHMIENGLESHMYASQWFLTVFTAKFPLFLVFRVLDVFLLSGFDTIFQVALAILKVSKKDLLQLDFEGLMKYFRVNVPKRYRSEENAKHLMSVACAIKLKKLKKYEKEYLAARAAERAREDPVVRLERENKKLLADNMRLDTENDNLASQLVNGRIEMRREIDRVEDARDILEKDAVQCKALLDEALEEKRRLEGETEQLKALLKREVDKLDTELATRNNVIIEYKAAMAALTDKLERMKCVEKGEVDTASSGERQKSQNDRIRELELELAQTKLALVETECKNQDLVHQFSASQHLHQEQYASSSTKKWFSKTLSSIKESAHTQVAAAAAAATSSTHAQKGQQVDRDPLKKSTSVDAIKSEFRHHPSN